MLTNFIFITKKRTAGKENYKKRRSEVDFTRGQSYYAFRLKCTTYDE